MGTQKCTQPVYGRAGQLTGSTAQSSLTGQSEQWWWVLAVIELASIRV